jgi:2-amino-4-hydroxy-6-hydroxymethyldihydropteridine diphosphokinase
MPRAYVGLGSNLGRREQMLRQALELLAAEPGVEVVASSSIRETEPVDYEDQPRFLNAGAAVETELPPGELLERLLSIEQRLGRRRTAQRYGPRTIDLDLLVYDDVILDAPGLTLPHPRLAARGFALEPLAELDPELVVPGAGRVSDLLAKLVSR